MSILNQMRKNPAMTAGAFIFIIALIVLIGWLVTRGSKGAAGPSGSAQGKPQIILNKTQKILHPNKSDVETYIVEYAEGVKGGSSAKYIDIKINWSNGGGFKMTGVTALKFTRKSGDNVIDTITTTGLSDSDKYIKDFGSDLSVLFKGTDELDKYLSKGKIPVSIVVEYITDGVGDPQSLATTAIDITESDLDTTLNIDSISTINSIPVMSGKGFTPALDTSSTKTTYSIMFDDDGKQIPELREIRMKVDEHGWIEFHKDGTQVDVAGKQMATYKQTYKFVEFGTDSDKYLLLARFNSVGDGQYLLYAPSAALVDRWAFAADTVITPSDSAADADDGLSNIMADKAVYDRAFVGIIENSPSVPLSYMYVPQVLRVPNSGFGTVTADDVKYVSSIDCELACSADENCVAAMYTDTVNSTVNDRACYGLPVGTGNKTYKTHTHYSTLVKEPFEEGVVENPKFIDGTTPVVAGTPWAGTTGWKTSSSTSAIAYNSSWHVFSGTSSKAWATWTNDSERFVGIKYPRKVVLKGYVVASTSDVNNYTPAKVVIEGSNDSTKWVAIKETTTPKPSTTVGYSKNRTSIIAREKLTNTTGYSSYRVRIPDNNSAYNNINEVRLFTTLGSPS